MKILILTLIIFIVILLFKLFQYKKDINMMKIVLEKENRFNNINKIYYNLIRTWMFKKLNADEIAHILHKKGIKDAYIYGYGYIGELLEKDLQNSDQINVRGIIDKSIFSEANPDLEYLKEATIIITPIYVSHEIKTDLERAGIKNTISLDEIIYSDLY